MVINNNEFFNELGKLHRMLNWEQHSSCISLSGNQRRPTKVATKVHVDRVERGLFRYDVTACETKVILRDYGFVAQLNERCHLKRRPTEFRVDKFLQPFDGSKFNFMKVGQEEILFQFESSDDGEVKFYPSAPIDAEKSPNFVAINVNPIKYGHICYEEFLESLTDVFFVQREPFRAHLSSICMADDHRGQGAVDDIGSSCAPVPIGSLP
nr:GDP-L-galactose phosphorylase 1-like [Tanacetum cinerariifolium]